MSHNRPNVVIAWNGLPMYAARLIRAGISQVKTSVGVLGSKPSVPSHPREDVEKALGQPIQWIDNDRTQSWKAINHHIPGLFIHTGWAYRGFNSLAWQVKLNGGQVVSMIDNRHKKSLRQWVGALVFRSLYRPRIDGAWVPGKSGRSLCRWFGMRDENIFEGLYGADPDEFIKGEPLPKRTKTFLFVGQLIRRKGVDYLLKAFRRFRQDYPHWTLHIVGEGDITMPAGEPGLQLHGHLKPEEVSELMQASRFLVLPSREDHWGMVVHEAALCGCGLIVSDNVGARLDLVRPDNGVDHKAGSVDSLEKALRCSASKSQEWLYHATTRSRDAAERFGPSRWAKEFRRIIDRYI